VRRLPPALFFLLALVPLVPWSAPAQAPPPDPPKPPSPRAVIAAPEHAAPGDLVVLSAEGSTASAFAWFPVEGAERFLPVDGGRRAVFASGQEGDFHFLLIATAMVDGKPAIDLASVTVTVGEPDPGPWPDDDGPPTTRAPPPHGADLASLVRLEVARVNLPPESRDRDAVALAGVFRGLADRALAGVFRSAAEMDATCRRQVRDTLGADLGAWSGFGRLVTAQTRGVRSLEALRLINLAIADGLAPAPVPPDPTPPPGPVPPPVPPGPEPTPVAAGHLVASYILPTAPTAAQAALRTDPSLRAALKALDTSWFTYQQDEEDVDSLGLAPLARTLGVPCVIVQSADGKVVAELKAPLSADSVAATIRQLRGGK
jgi:hypothetical protein